MKIKDLDFVNSKEVKKLGKYAYMTIEDYIKRVKSLKDNGVRPNKVLQTIYNELIARQCMDNENKTESASTDSEIPGIPNWSYFKEKIKDDLSFYEHWFEFEGYNFNICIEKFIKFLQDSKNDNLKISIPNNLNHYWSNPSDSFYRTALTNSLSTGFEGLLAEIIYKKTGLEKNIDGLSHILKDGFPHLLSLTTTHISETKGFDKIFIKLKNYRNKFCHGKYIEQNNEKSERTLKDFTALFVHTVFKYAA